MTSALLLSTLLLFGAAPARSKAEQKLEKGQTEFNRGNFAAALKALDAAAADSTEPAALARIHLLRGQAFAAQQQFDEAEGSFALALENDPEATLDPAKVDPRIVQLLDGLRARTKADVTLATDPSGAEVKVDGAVVGKSPLTTQLPVGRHKIEAISGDRSRQGAVDIVVAAKKPNEVSLPLDVPRTPEAPKAPEKTEVFVAEKPALRPFADLRGGWSVLDLIDGLGFEIGGGVEQKFWQATVHLKLFPHLGFTPRGGIHVPITEKARILVDAELPVLFDGSPIAVGIGGASGIEYVFLPAVSGFSEVGFRYYFFGPNYQNDRQLFLQLGLRLRLPD